MTRIFVFNNACRASGYGIGTYVRQSVKGMANRDGYEVSLVDLWADINDFEISTDPEEIRHYRIPHLPYAKEDETYLRSVFYFLSRHMDIGEDDRLVFHFNYFHHYPLALLLKGHYPKCRIVLTVHYLSWCFELKGNLTEFRKILAEHDAISSRWGADPDEGSDGRTEQIVRSTTQERSFLHLADEVIVLSRRTMDILAGDYGVPHAKAHLIYNGAEDTVRQDCTPPTAQTVRNVLFVGRLDEIKGLEYLIKAFNRIADKHPTARLVVAGDGDFQVHLEKARRIHDRVSFLGKMDRDEVQSLYSSAYIGAIPSFH